MDPQRPQMNDDQVVRAAKVIWAALSASIVMYLLIAFQLGSAVPVKPVPSAEEIKRLEFILSICGTVAFFLGFLLPRLLARAMKTKPTANSVPSLAKKFPPYLLRLALFESVALFGLVLAVQTSSGRKMWPFLIVSAIGFLISFPSKEKLETL